MEIDLFEEINKYYQTVESIDISYQEIFNVLSTTFDTVYYITTISSYI